MTKKQRGHSPRYLECAPKIEQKNCEHHGRNCLCGEAKNNRNKAFWNLLFSAQKKSLEERIIDAYAPVLERLAKEDNNGKK